FGLLAGGLAAVAGPMGPAEAPRVCAEAAPLLTQALAKEKDANVRLQLATGLTVVAGRREPAEAARLLNQALAHENDADVPVVPAGPGGMPGVNAARLQLAAGLPAVVERLEPAEATRVGAETARLLNQALTRE